MTFQLKIGWELTTLRRFPSRRASKCRTLFEPFRGRRTSGPIHRGLRIVRIWSLIVARLMCWTGSRRFKSCRRQCRRQRATKRFHFFSIWPGGWPETNANNFERDEFGLPLSRNYSLDETSSRRRPSTAIGGQTMRTEATSYVRYRRPIRLRAREVRPESKGGGARKTTTTMTPANT